MAHDKYCLDNCDQEQKSAFVDAIYKRSRMTWAEIVQAPAHGLGFEKLPRFRIQNTLPPGVTEDVTFLSFRCIGKAPMVGYRDGQIFHVLWIDHDFTLYNHGS